MKKWSWALLIGLLAMVSCTNTEQQAATEPAEDVATEIKLADTQQAFWDRIASHCGKAYEGKFVGTRVPEDFEGKELIMYVMTCDENTLKVPFYVGDDHSRTWVLTKTPDGILLKHDHRLEDGSDDVGGTMYGGMTQNAGKEHVQFFAADQFTADMIDGAEANLWWITIDDKEYTYNLRRVTTPNHFSVAFDLTNPIETPERPWGH